MDKEQIQVEESIIALVDLYNKEAEKNRLFYLKHRINNPDSGLKKEPFISFYKFFESKVEASEVTEFLYEFGIIRSTQTFEHVSHSDSLIKSFNLLKLPIPSFVLECQKEVIHRKGFIKSYLEKEKYKWTENEINAFLIEVQKEASTYSFNDEINTKYLRGKFKNAIKEIKEIESDIQKTFDYFVDGFYDGENFVATESDLNQYFYHSEKVSNGYGSFFPVWKALSKFIKKNNELFALRSLLRECKLSTGNDNESLNIVNKSNPFESIWLRNPIVSINEFLQKGFDLACWDEDYNLIAKRGALYGSKKMLLANIYIALKGNSINENIDHKKVGEIFCKFFKIEIDSKTENPFKQFQKGDQKQIELLRKRLK